VGRAITARQQRRGATRGVGRPARFGRPRSGVRHRDGSV